MEKNKSEKASQILTEFKELILEEKVSIEEFAEKLDVWLEDFKLREGEEITYELRIIMQILKIVITIYENPPDGEMWSKKDWNDYLTKKIPTWKKTLKSKEYFVFTEYFTPKSSEKDLYELCIDVCGLELVKEWLFAENSIQQKLAKEHCVTLIDYHKAKQQALLNTFHDKEKTNG